MRLPSLRLLQCFVLSISFLQLGDSYAASEQGLIRRYERAIVKLTVSGKGIDGREKEPVEGSGVIIFSTKFTLILTATHLIGSSSTANNPNWMVNNGVVSRTIQVEGLNSEGALGVINQNANVLPVQFPEGIDIAVLSIGQKGYPSISLPRPSLNFGASYEVMLLGFKLGQRELSAPWVSTMGVPKPSGIFETGAPSRPGESGGAWLNKRNGQLLGIASGVNSTPERVLYSAGYVPLIMGQLQAIVPPDSFRTAANDADDAEDKTPDAQGNTLPLDRTQWTQSYLQPSPGTNSPISGSRYGVVVASFDSLAYGRQKLVQLCSKFPGSNFALLGSASQNGGSYQIEAGYNLTGKDADRLVQTVKELGIAKDAYKRIYGWDGYPGTFPDCLNPNRVFKE